ncbi:hypothetical protein CR513_35920, partial [Mucuna pruriens]
MTCCCLQKHKLVSFKLNVSFDKSRESYFDQISASGITNICDVINNVTKGSTSSPQNNGGLGLREMNTISQASMVKLGWKLVNNHQDLWVLKVTWPNMKDNLSWRVHNGELTKFWTDMWVPSCGRLLPITLLPLSKVECTMLIAYFTNKVNQ